MPPPALPPSLGELPEGLLLLAAPALEEEEEGLAAGTDVSLTSVLMFLPLNFVLAFPPLELVEGCALLLELALAAVLLPLAGLSSLNAGPSLAAGLLGFEASLVNLFFESTGGCEEPGASILPETEFEATLPESR